MTKEFDQRSSYRALKAHENMIAFVDFQVQPENDLATDGVVKVASSKRPFGGKQLTLTFIIDTAENESLQTHLNEKFQSLSSAHLEPYFGRTLERMVKVSLDSLAGIKNWYIEEIGLHLSSAEERESVLIEEMLMPALDCGLGFKFGAVEWWPQGKTRAHLSPNEIEAQKSPKSLFKRWFGVS